MTDLSLRTLLVVGLCAGVLPLASAQSGASRIKPGDHIAVVVNQDVVAASEITLRAERARAEARRRGEANPDMEALRKQAMEALIEERAMVTLARETGQRVDEPELDRVVANVATQNKLTMPELKERLKADGMDFKTFRENLRDQMLMERVREREVQKRISINDGDIDRYLEERQAKADSNPQLNIAQVLVPIPEKSTQAQVAERLARAETALARIKAGEDFARIAREFSEDANKDRGGEVGLRQAERLPDVFVDAVRELKPGQVNPRLIRSEVGVHIIKLLAREAAANPNIITQTHSRHVLLRPSQQLTPEVAARRLQEFKRAIEAGQTSFEQVARDNSEDGSAPNGGDLGWVSPGAFVPEFEEAMNALPLNGISGPVMSRYGVHMIQVLERRQVELEPKQLREQARVALRERRYEDAYKDWLKELRANAFIEMREWQ
ncbi:peptidylprolyl isomerase [Roseateles sp. DB2]|uniref:peptidylprolyl isomerase n=1 Tax=Roseateles sp. DB2 TaxID=3453717 RepID=UPI003EEE8A26